MFVSHEAYPNNKHIIFANFRNIGVYWVYWGLSRVRLWNSFNQLEKYFASQTSTFVKPISGGKVGMKQRLLEMFQVTVPYFLFLWNLKSESVMGMAQEPWFWPIFQIT